MPINSARPLQYTPSEVSTITQNAMTIGQFDELRTVIDTKQKICPKKNVESASDQATSSHIFKLYEKPVANTDRKRKVALFNVTAISTDDNFDSSDTLTTLQSALEIYKNSPYDCDELIIPIFSKNHKPKLLKLLHFDIVWTSTEKCFLYNWNLYNPCGLTYPNDHSDNDIISKIVTDTLGQHGSGEEVHLNQMQLDSSNNEEKITLSSAMCSLYNFFHILNNKKVAVNFKINKDNTKQLNDKLTLIHGNVEQAKKLAQDYATQLTISAPVHSTENSIASPDSLTHTDSLSVQSAPSSVDDHSSSASSTNVDAPLSLLVNNETITLHPITEKNINAFEAIKQLQTKIMNTQNWGTKLGGNNVFYYYSTVSGHKDTSRKPVDATIPDGVNLILKTIQTVQDYIFTNKAILNEDEINDLYSAAYCKIVEIAKERDDHPPFSFCFFNVRSETTSQFYKDIINDQNAKNLASQSHAKLNFLLRT